QMNWHLLQNSLFVSAATTLIALLFGFTGALWLAALPSRWHRFLIGIAIVALALPPFLVTNCWLSLLGQAGRWQGWLPFNIFSLGGTVWILALLTWPITLLLVLSAWGPIEASQLEADSALRGSLLVRWLLWPMARPAVGLSAVLTFA